MKEKSLIRIIVEKLFCKHEWEEIDEIKVYETDYDDLPYRYKKLYHCTKCGKFKTISL